jgi:hypothetical protein
MARTPAEMLTETVIVQSTRSEAAATRPALGFLPVVMERTPAFPLDADMAS